MTRLLVTPFLYESQLPLVVLFVPSLCRQPISLRCTFAQGHRKMPVGKPCAGPRLNVMGQPADGGEIPEDVEYYPLSPALSHY